MDTASISRLPFSGRKPYIDALAEDFVAAPAGSMRRLSIHSTSGTISNSEEWFAAVEEAFARASAK